MPIFVEPLLQPLFEQTQVSMTTLKKTGLAVEEKTFLAIGGGIGSFTWIDHLIIHGVDPANAASIGLAAKPYARCRQLCRNSQIFDADRLRSDSGSTPDNIWGWPGYALREIGYCLKQGQVKQAVWLAWQIFCEPVLCEPFTPKAGDVFASLDREAKRIDWSKIWRFGWVHAIRKTDDGRYVVIYSPVLPFNSATIPLKRRYRLMVAQYIHLAVGYPGPRVLPDLQTFRQTGNGQQFVNAYEPHDHVYDQLSQSGGTVFLRGRGITASRIIERLHKTHRQHPDINILHIMRTPQVEGTHYRYARRVAQNHFEHQAYNFPKSCFGGDFHFTLENASNQERAELINTWGGITTAKRHLWEDIITTGLNEGWYKIRVGQLTNIMPTNRKLMVTLQDNSSNANANKLQADFIIDATGLETAPERNSLLKDLLQTYHLPKNNLGQIQVTNNFEIADLRNQNGRIYASGIITLGGPFAPVDSFVGLQYAAQKSVQSLIEQGVPGVHRLGPIASIRQWLRWANGVKP